MRDAEAVDGTHVPSRGRSEPATETVTLGRRLRERRLKRGLSLEVLASRCGLSRSGLSKIERGEVVPSTTNLSRIAEALGTSFAALMSPASEGEVVVLRAEDQPVMKDGRSGFTRRCIAPILPSRGLDWVLNHLPAGESTGVFVPHRAGVDEYIYVLSGRLEARLGRARHALEEGDALYFQAQVAHEFVATEDGACDYLLIIDNQTR